MVRLDPQQGLTPSILDRLIDPDSAGSSWRGGYGLEQLIASVRRDLEDLLNTHRSEPAIPEEFVETRGSTIGYGLPDLVSYGAAVGPEVGRRVGRAIEQAIARFEPRLRDVRAVPVDAGGDDPTVLRFHLGATIAVEPFPEVAFVTILKLTTGQASIQRSRE